VVAAGLVAMALLFVIGNYGRLQSGDTDTGFDDGAGGDGNVRNWRVSGRGGELTVAGGIGRGDCVAAAIQGNRCMSFVAAVGEKDIRAIMSFVLVTLVILPVLPNRALGPYESLNPFKIWLFVVLIVSLSLAGYVIYKFLGGKGRNDSGRCAWEE